MVIIYFTYFYLFYLFLDLKCSLIKLIVFLYIRNIDSIYRLNLCRVIDFFSINDKNIDGVENDTELFLEADVKYFFWIIEDTLVKHVTGESILSRKNLLSIIEVCGDIIKYIIAKQIEKGLHYRFNLTEVYKIVSLVLLTLEKLLEEKEAELDDKEIFIEDNGTSLSK